MAWPQGGDTVRLWEPRTGTKVADIPGSQPPFFSPDGGLLATNVGEETLVWKAQETGRQPVRRRGTALAFVSAEDLLVRDGKRLCRWHVPTGRETFATPEGLEFVAVSGDGRVAALSGKQAADGHEAITFWDLNIGKPVHTLPDIARGLAKSAAVMPTSFSRDGRFLAFRDPTDPGILRLWDTTTQRSRGLRGPAGDSAEPLVRAEFSADGSMLAAQSGSHTVFIWDVDSGREIASLRDNHSPVWSGDGRLLATIAPGEVKIPIGTFRLGAGLNGLVKVWEVAPPTPTYLLSKPITSLSFQADGQKLAANAVVWDVRRQEKGLVLRPGPSKLQGHWAVFADGGQLWTAEFQQQDRPVGIWQVAPKARALSSLPQPGPVNCPCLAVSPDGKKLALNVAADLNGPEHLEIWDLATGKRLSVCETGQVRHQFLCIQFSGDGNRLATGSNSGLVLWDVATGKMLHHLYYENSVKQEWTGEKLNVQIKLRATSIPCVHFSHDGRLVFSGTRKMLDFAADINVAEVETGRELGPWQGHEGTVLALALSPDGRTLASGAEDRTIRLWEVPTGVELARWDAHAASVASLAFSPDGKTLVSGDAEGVLKLWNLPFLHKELDEIGLDW